MMEETNQAVHTIKELLERMELPQGQQAPRPKLPIEGTRVEQQVAKATTRGHAISNRRANSQQVTRSQAESTQSAAMGRRIRDKAGHSQPHNKNNLRSHYATWSHIKVVRKKSHRGPHPTIPQCVQSARSKQKGGHAYAFGGEACFRDLQKKAGGSSRFPG